MTKQTPEGIKKKRTIQEYKHGRMIWGYSDWTWGKGDTAVLGALNMYMGHNCSYCGHPRFAGSWVIWEEDLKGWRPICRPCQKIRLSLSYREFVDLFYRMDEVQYGSNGWRIKEKISRIKQFFPFNKISKDGPCALPLLPGEFLAGALALPSFCVCGILRQLCLKHRI